MFLLQAIHDEEKLAAMQSLPSLRWIIWRSVHDLGMPVMVKENGVMNRTVVCEFPSVEVAKTAVDSPAYAEAPDALDGARIEICE